MADELIWLEDVARICGYQPATVMVKASVSRRRSNAREPLRPSDLPLPVDWVRRQVSTRSGGQRGNLSPRWRKSDIDAFLARRRPRGNPNMGPGYGAKPKAASDGTAA